MITQIGQVIYVNKNDGGYIAWAVFDAVERNALSRIRYISAYILAKNLKLAVSDVKQCLDKLVDINILEKRYNLSCAHCYSQFNTYKAMEDIPIEIECPFCGEMMEHTKDYIETTYYINDDFREALRNSTPYKFNWNKFGEYNEFIMRRFLNRK